jgi:hypothetical protein
MVVPMLGRVFVMVVMLAEQILAKVVGRVAPDGMDVVGIILRIVELN